MHPSVQSRHRWVALLLFLPNGCSAQGDFVLLQNVAVVEQFQRALAFQDQHFVGMSILGQTIIGHRMKDRCHHNEKKNRYQ